MILIDFEGGSNCRSRKRRFCNDKERECQIPKLQNQSIPLLEKRTLLLHSSKNEEWIYNLQYIFSQYNDLLSNMKKNSESINQPSTFLEKNNFNSLLYFLVKNGKIWYKILYFKEKKQIPLKVSDLLGH